MTGSELRTRREAGGVRAADLAKILGVTRSAITHLEARDYVQPATAARFLEGVMALATQRRLAATEMVTELTAKRAELARIGHAAIDQGLDLLMGSALGDH